MSSNSFTYNLRQQFQTGNMVIRLIFINLAVYFAVLLGSIFFKLILVMDSPLVSWLALPIPLGDLIFKPWTLITYMFLHEELFFHLFFNMLMFYFFGQVFIEFVGNKRMLAVYILGGLAGAFATLITYALLPGLREIYSSYMLGASASVIAIVIATVVLQPNYTFYMFFLGPVKIKYIAVVLIILDLISIERMSNTGGHIAHLGGAMFGFFFIRQLRSGRDWSENFNRIFNSFLNVFTKRSGPKVAYKSGNTVHIKRKTGVSRQEKIDIILDKISKSGYDSMTKEEKELLFRASKED